VDSSFFFLKEFQRDFSFLDLDLVVDDALLSAPSLSGNGFLLGMVLHKDETPFLVADFFSSPAFSPFPAVITLMNHSLFPEFHLC